MSTPKDAIAELAVGGSGVSATQNSTQRPDAGEVEMNLGDLGRTLGRGGGADGDGAGAWGATSTRTAGGAAGASPDDWDGQVVVMRAQPTAASIREAGERAAEEAARGGEPAAARPSAGARQEKAPPANPVARRLNALVKPNGNYNRRVLAGTVLVVVALVLVMTNTSAKKKQDPAEVDGKARAADGPRNDSRVITVGSQDSTLASPGGGGKGPQGVKPGEGLNSSPQSGVDGLPNAAPGGAGANANPNPVAAAAAGQRPGAAPVNPYLPRPAAPAPPPPAAGTQAAQAAAAAPDDNSRENKGSGVSDDIRVIFRAGQRAEKRDERDAQAAERAEQSAGRAEGAGAAGGGEPAAAAAGSLPVINLPAGTRIQMELQEPLRSGIATSVTAMVTADVRDGAGRVVVPRGTTAAIPFLASEINGRMDTNPRQAITFVFADGSAADIYGRIKGPDRYAGIGGKVIVQGGAGRAARTIGAITQGALGGISVASGGVLGGAADAARGEGVNEAEQLGGGYERSRRVVEIKEGTPFTLVVASPNAK